ncbi:MAG: helix-turn-helix transcriptional regulator [Candidatus Gastranaerophilaceae bacterium]|nr:helix-turn-helix transcriptional regulator [Candidatus Gastranaerophilaceae bacterium]
MYDRSFNLTQIEIQILQLVAEGMDNVEIAKTLFISRHTVKAHLTSAYRKLNATNRANAVYVAMKQQYIN